MEKNSNVVFKRDFENRKRHAEQERKLKEIENQIPSGYQSDIRMYQKYCRETGQQETLDSLSDYLFISITKDHQRISKKEYLGKKSRCFA